MTWYHKLKSTKEMFNIMKTIQINISNLLYWLPRNKFLIRVLYWACHFDDIDLIKRIISFKDLFIEVTMSKYEN